MVRPMVHSNKHYVQHSINTIVASTQSIFTFIDAVAVSDKTAPNEVEEGSSIKACFIEAWLRTGDTANGSYVGVLRKQSGGDPNLSLTEMAALNDADGKKNILWTGMGLINNQNSDAIPILRSWYKIPKSKQRFGLGDKLVLQVFAQGAIDLHHCGFETYKEYT